MDRNPTENEIAQIVLQIKESAPHLGVAKVLAKIKSIEPTWSLSLSRLKTVLKSNSASQNDPKAFIPDDVKPRLYVSQTTSAPVPNLELPPSVEVFSSTTRGKGLEVSSKLGSEIIAEETVLWTEPALVLIPPLSLVGLIPTGKACSFCARPITSVSTLVASCPTCSGKWCTTRCRKLDKLHKHIRHGKYAPEWAAIEAFAIQNEWSACFLYAYCLAASTFEELDEDKSGKHMITNGVNGLAKIRQDVRQQADPKFESTMFMSDQFDILWESGYGVIAKFFDHYSPPSYGEFLEGIGMVNINSLDGSIYLIQSHLNHSCEPNVNVKIVGRTAGVKVSAKRALHAKEELTTTYVDLKGNLSTRRQRLLEGWGFWCTCPRCVREERDLALPEITNLHITPPGVTIETELSREDARKRKKKSKGKQKQQELPGRKKSVSFDETIVEIDN
ncbi:hypothetical protein V1512DRAFT_268006 [Lipomyces arxii]|uniref:uncharacterized protein n=1 Tax=Lipomyces arxii TaxID=56418 RepID=UPI0034CFD669